MPSTRLSTIRNTQTIHKSISKPNIVNKWCQHDQKLRSEVSGRRQKWANRGPKGAKSSPKRDKRCPKATKASPKEPQRSHVRPQGATNAKNMKKGRFGGTHFGGKNGPKIMKKASFYKKGPLKARSFCPFYNERRFPRFLLRFWPNFPPKIDVFFDVLSSLLAFFFECGDLHDSTCFTWF